MNRSVFQGKSPLFKSTRKTVDSVSTTGDFAPNYFEYRLRSLTYSYLSEEEAASPSASVERPHPGEVEGAGRALLPRPRWPALAAPLPAGESDDPDSISSPMRQLFHGCHGSAWHASSA
jgi:hypothetical protein